MRAAMAPLLRLLSLALWLAAALTACVSEPAAPAPAAEDCAGRGDEDGDGLIDCADPDCADTAACQPRCGDGVLTAGEACDDGNVIDGDGCDANCTPTACGNGVLTDGETCDDGNLCNDDGCDANCTPTACGNGVVTPSSGEECDDGNLTDGDGCDANCTPTACGNGVLTSGEACDDGNLASGDGCDANCTPTACGNGVVTPSSGEACDDGNAQSGDGCENDCTATPVITYIKSTNTEFADEFGRSVALSADGSTLAVGAIIEDSAARGVNGNQANNSALDSGAVYVYVRSGASWSFQAYIKASNTDADDEFGYSVALSADGSTLVVGAVGEDSSARGVNGDQSNNSAYSAGAVYVFTRSGTTWAQQAYVKASNDGGWFGYSVALSGDGATLAVGAHAESGAATGVNGDQFNYLAQNAGAVYVFTRSGTTWAQQAYVKASNTNAFDLFGASVALSADGATLAVGAYKEGSAATGIGGNQADNSAASAGAVYVFTRSGTTWAQQAYVKASNTGAGDEFGYSVALSSDGATLAVGADREASAATGVGGDQANNSAVRAGAAYVFTRSGTTWAQHAYVKASNTDANDFLGQSVALSGDGRTLLVGAPLEDSAATGINGNQTDNSDSAAGAAYVFTRSGTTWAQHAYVKASNVSLSGGGSFGYAAALSSDGSTLAVCAPLENGAGVGPNADPNAGFLGAAGAVYTYR